MLNASNFRRRHRVAAGKHFATRTRRGQPKAKFIREIAGGTRELWYHPTKGYRTYCIPAVA